VAAGVRERAMTDAEIMAALSEILSDGRRVLRKYLIADEHDRKGLLLGLYREGTRPVRAMAELIEVLDVDADARRRVTRILGEIEAATA
jgi:hypothetical protein